MQASERKNRSQKHLLRAQGFRAEAENRHNIVFAVLQAVALAVSQQRNHAFNKFVHLTDLISVLVPGDTSGNSHVKSNAVQDI